MDLLGERLGAIGGVPYKPRGSPIAILGRSSLGPFHAVLGLSRRPAAVVIALAAFALKGPS